MYVIDRKHNHYYNLNYYSDFRLCQWHPNSYGAYYTPTGNYSVNEQKECASSIKYCICCNCHYAHTDSKSFIATFDTRAEAEECLNRILDGLLKGLPAIEI